ncbi:E3 ubiquitin-protein ligase synoviolin [Tritrichomonas musculus]|uniref:E3 ubiquitin-protein ligase synoviolin n=1 Tax=Tritrichomonas musculus TaxID=1915356 RepID=A0ABR2L623_9EUKA
MWRLQRVSLFIVLLYVGFSLINYTNALDFICSLSSSKIFSFLFMVFFVDLIYLIVQTFLRDIFKYNFSAEYELADHLLGSRYITLFIFFAMNDRSFLQQTFIPTLIFAYLYKLIIDLENLITCFSTQLPPKYAHWRLFVIQIGLFTILFITFCVSLKMFVASKSTLCLSMLEISSEFLVTLCTDLFAHITFIGSRPNPGNSIHTERKIQWLRYISMIINNILFLFSAFLRTKVSHQFIQNLIIFLWGLVQLTISIDSMLRWKKLIINIRQKLKVPCDASLEQDDICIVCRQTMTKETSKELPCRHCCHTHCLERWVKKQSVCPICNSDLSFLKEIQNNPIDNM